MTSPWAPVLSNFLPHTVLEADRLNDLIRAIEVLRERVAVLEDEVQRFQSLQATVAPPQLTITPRVLFRFKDQVAYRFRVHQWAGPRLADVTEQTVVLDSQHKPLATSPDGFRPTKDGTIPIFLRFNGMDVESKLEVKPYRREDWNFRTVKLGTGGKLQLGHTGMAVRFSSLRSTCNHELYRPTDAQRRKPDLVLEGDLLPRPGDDLTSELLLLVHTQTTTTLRVQVEGEQGHPPLLPWTDYPVTGSLTPPDEEFCEVPIAWVGLAARVRVQEGVVLAIAARKDRAPDS